MADKNLLEQMLERLVNDDQAKAEELFHEYVVGKSREIYEELIEAEMTGFGDEMGDDEMGDEMGDEDPMGGDPTDDLEQDLDAELGGEESQEGDTADLFQNLEDIVDELQAKFDELAGGEMGDEDGFGDDEMGDEEEYSTSDDEEEYSTSDDEEEMKDSFDLETVREYVEQVGGKQYNQFGKMGDNGANTKSIVAGKNDMGGTTANILSGRNGSGSVEANQGQLKGNGLLKGTAKEDNSGNINVPGGKAGSAFSKKEPGHGAEKKGTAETADSKQSLFRGRR
jgi:hypothetical protein